MKNRNLLQSFNNAVEGIIYAIRNEKNIRIHTAAAALILTLSLFYDLTNTEFLIVCLTIGLVIICEIFNTALEIVVDIIVDVYHPKAKAIKDIAAGAVLVAAFISLIVAYFIFFDRVSESMDIGINRVKQSPVHLTVIALIVTIITVMVLKAITGKGTPFRGGMPSGHAALALSITTAVTLWTEDIRISILCMLLSLMVLQSRLERGIHSILELAAGAAIGSILTLLLFQIFFR